MISEECASGLYLQSLHPLILQSLQMDIFKSATPFVQAGISVALGLFFMVSCLLFESTMELRPERPWVFASTFLLFYSIFNVVFSFNVENAEKYWTQAVIGFVATVGALGALAYLISGLGMNDAGAFKWIFIVITISYLIFMSIARAMKGIVDFAQKEEWNSPKMRDRQK